MATVTTTRPMTAEEFMAADLGEGNFELVRGEVVEVPPAMPEHGRLCGDASYVLETYGRQSGRGFALSNDSAVLTERDPDTVRGAGVCFYSHARWPRSEVGTHLPPVPPDVAVEVVS
ncbi:MAG: Uma2 family endonuclease, partial [Isosphaeraceae bacterium]